MPVVGIGWGVMTNAWSTTEAAGAPPGASVPIVRRLESAWSLAAASEPATREQGVRDLYARTHADMVRFAAFLTGDVHVAEDIAHEAYVRVFDAWDRIEQHDRIDAYLKATVVNLVRGNHRRDVVAARHRSPHLTLVASAEETALGRFGRDRVLTAVAGLPLRQRACVVMRHWMRMTETEIADTLDISVGSVRTHTKRGTETLKRSLGDAR